MTPWQLDIVHWKQSHKKGKLTELIIWFAAQLDTGINNSFMNLTVPFAYVQVDKHHTLHGHSGVRLFYKWVAKVVCGGSNRFHSYLLTLQIKWSSCKSLFGHLSWTLTYLYAPWCFHSLPPHQCFTQHVSPCFVHDAATASLSPSHTAMSFLPPLPPAVPTAAPTAAPNEFKKSHAHSRRRETETQLLPSVSRLGLDISWRPWPVRLVCAVYTVQCMCLAYCGKLCQNRFNPHTMTT